MKENLYTQTITFDTNTFITILESILDYLDSNTGIYDLEDLKYSKLSLLFRM